MTLYTLRRTVNDIQRALESPGTELENAESMLQELETARNDVEDALMNLKYKIAYIKRWKEEWQKNH